MLRSLLNRLGRTLAGYLTRPRDGLSGAPVATAVPWTEYLQPADVLLVDGSSRVATGIKYLTQSTWSHAAICVGAQPVAGEAAQTMLVEADVRDGVRTVPVSFYSAANVRICRPVGLAAPDRERVLRLVCDAIGHQYDLRNVVDLLRWLLPEPPVPARFRRRMIALGSGEPTRAICSTLIARAFQEVRYPIIPVLAGNDPEAALFLQRHHSFITPRDFDLSPYFRVVKPTLEAGFDYRAFPWQQED